MMGDDRESEPACLICGGDLVYLDNSEEMECAICHRKMASNACCVKGHFVCDECHSDPAIGAVRTVCRNSVSKDPIDIFLKIVKDPSVHMHGPEHHVIVGSSLLTAYRNAGGDIDLDEALGEMSIRGKKVPGGSCGMAGCCGAAVSAGMFYSIITKTSPLSSVTWGDCNILTSECLAKIGSVGGPRCCKRDSVIAMTAAVGFVADHLNVRMELPKHYVCSFSERNAQCIGERCPFHPKG